MRLARYVEASIDGTGMRGTQSRSTGLIVNVGPNGNAEDIRLVQDLVTEYISKPACIILLTVACESTPRIFLLSHRALECSDRFFSRLPEPGRVQSRQEIRQRRISDYWWVFRCIRVYAMP